MICDQWHFPRTMAIVATLTLSICCVSEAFTGDDVQKRIDKDIRKGKPLVVHVTVALCDNEHQGIVPVPAQLGNGRDPANNLYWGALYGVRTFLTSKDCWKLVDKQETSRKEILQRIVLKKTIVRKGTSVPVYLVADAWDGEHIQNAIDDYLRVAAGQIKETIKVADGNKVVDLSIGSAAHIAAYVGHDGLMEFSLTMQPPASDSLAQSAVVLCCLSKKYFSPHLQTSGVHPLLMTTGLMAPEAYILAAAIKSWLSGESHEDVLDASAKAYNHYQRCDLKAARRLFTVNK